MKWLVYTRGLIQLYRIDMAYQAIHLWGSKLNGARTEDILHATEGGHMWWCWNRKDIEALGKKILRSISTQKGKTEHFKSLERYLSESIRASATIQRTQLEKLSDAQLESLFDWHFQKVGPAHAVLDPDVDSMDVVLERHLTRMIRRELRSKLTANEIVGAVKHLLVPVYRSYISEETLAVARVEKSGWQKDNIDRLYRRFWWTTLGWERIHDMSRVQYEKRVRGFANDPDKLNYVKKHFSNVRRRRHVFLRELGISKRIRYWLEILDWYTAMHDKRKEMQVKNVYAYRALLKEVARRLGASVHDLEWLTVDEVLQTLRSRKIPAAEIKRRSKALLVIVTKQKIAIYSGISAIRRRKRELGADDHARQVLKGMGVSVGVVRGRAKVCSGSLEAERKVKKGDILVCGMTMPDYVPVMKRAAAVVTDEGGATCHAAIISRELGLPCVVGTKIATRVFKDGERIEVDAGKGVVRKI
ncbi:MAG: PEP-utilizing enzyme [bacterium]|nr:PEP-utilizing enzyme [bacterium]